MLFKSIKKNWFTLVEVLLVCSIFAIMVVGIILAVNRSYTFMNNTKLQIQATNLAREWVEMIFNIRDTNWRKCSWKKDDFRLYLGSGSTKENECNTESKEFRKWIYTINEWKNSSWDTYVYSEKLNITSDSAINTFYWNDWFWTDAYNSSRWSAKITFTGTYYYASGSQVKTWIIKNLLEGVEFYRIVRVYNVYCKAVDGSDVELISNSCNEPSDPKELRFCVKVFYRNNWDPHSSELCSIMTNFEE